MGTIPNITKVVDFYKNNGFNAKVVVEEKTNLHHYWIWHQQHKDADCGLQVSGGCGGGRVRGQLVPGEVEEQKDGVGKLWHPSLKGGSTPNVRHHGN